MSYISEKNIDKQNPYGTKSLNHQFFSKAFRESNSVYTLKNVTNDYLLIKLIAIIQ